ncbi:hypothetical protein NQZ68_003515 [Dissostichus eleginoides]|nr:hypothetical protein NQZ68_003515 [Dissostichus eleginoides]
MAYADAITSPCVCHLHSLRLHSCGKPKARCPRLHSSALFSTKASSCLGSGVPQPFWKPQERE